MVVMFESNLNEESMEFSVCNIDIDCVDIGCVDIGCVDIDCIIDFGD